MTSLISKPSRLVPGWIAIVAIIGTSLEQPAPALRLGGRSLGSQNPHRHHGGVVFAAPLHGHLHKAVAGGLEVVTLQRGADLGEVDFAPESVSAEEETVAGDQRLLADRSEEHTSELQSRQYLV